MKVGSLEYLMSMSITVVVCLTILVLVFFWETKKQPGVSAKNIGAWLDLVGDKIVLGPDIALYRGSTIKRWSMIRGNGAVILTDHRVIFENMVLGWGNGVEIPLNVVESASIQTRYPLSFINQHPMIILHLRNGGKVEFLIKDADKWLQAIENAIRQE